MSEDETERIKRENEEQIQEMLRYKWLESEKAGHDLGNEAILDWIKKYAKDWRERHKNNK